MIDGDACAAAIMVVVGIMMLSRPRVRAGTRLRHCGTVRIGPSRRIGMLAVIEDAMAYIRSGGAPSNAFDDTLIRGGTIASLDIVSLRSVLARRAYEHETVRQIDGVAAELALAIRCSDRLGCELVRCLESVGESYRASIVLEELKTNALAMPKATVKLLSVLPVVTILLGEAMNAKPLGFLFGSVQGLVCLVMGMTAYAVGMIWMYAMLRNMTMETLSYGARERYVHGEAST